MTIEEMKQRKRELGYTNERVAELSGVPLGTVQKIFAGITLAPRYETLQALERIFRADTDFYGNPVCESTAPYCVKRQGEVKKPGEYTLEDYRALPEDRRAELIDGVIYDLSSPTCSHQMIQLDIGRQLADYIDSRQGACIPFTAPADVQLDMDSRTMVVPDVFVVCDRSKITRSHLLGAPDLIIEILSPSTWRKDAYLKLEKYAMAGVREYWLVDPERLKIMAYDLEQNVLAQLYTFSDQVPVAIFDGDCRIDFSRIYEKIRFLYK